MEVKPSISFDPPTADLPVVLATSSSSEIVEIQRSLRNLETKITNLDKFATRVDDWKER